LTETNLHGRVVDIAGVQVAGLGGVFRHQVWYPKQGDEDATITTRAQMLKATPKQNQWRHGLPKKHATTIFPEDFVALPKNSASVLVCHEAPSCHRFGFAGIDALAERLGVGTIVHGHHHERYETTLANGTRVLGVELGGLLYVPAFDLDPSLDRAHKP
jgi:hypothetical protein